MKIQIASDLHLEGFLQPGDYKEWHLPRTDADVIILAGDVWNLMHGLEWARDESIHHDKQVIMIFGNHDYWRVQKVSHVIELTNQVIPIGWETVEEQPMSSLIDRAREFSRSCLSEGVRLHFLERGEVIIDDVRFIGCTMWTDFGLEPELIKRILEPDSEETLPVKFWKARDLINDYAMIGAGKDRPTVTDILSTHVASFHWLKQKLSEPFTGKTVVITHHAPHPDCVDRRRWRCWGHDFEGKIMFHAYHTDFRDLIEQYQPAAWIHGHVHKANDFWHANTRVVSNPKGYGEPQKAEDIGKNPSELWEPGSRKDKVIDLDDVTRDIDQRAAGPDESVYDE